ncbi:carboxypeptidase Y [Purpureocillium lavendulum]|uniref:Carboxypeptidase n=1 Tax=Purpureocillium lavendulum TaxID=1247861 RepID=A0AB34FRB7_9HYPO|nr:carboxypeptidase Y [Purpureocillium lavendulum]
MARPRCPAPSVTMRFTIALALGAAIAATPAATLDEQFLAGRGTSEARDKASSQVSTTAKWDAIVNGADVQADNLAHGIPQWTDADMAGYSLRTRALDPKVLGIDTVKQYAGYLDNKYTDKHLFYCQFGRNTCQESLARFFESRNDPAKDPIILWLNGGPGCSSMIGLFTEIGPAFLPNADLKPVRNPNSWNTKASVLFLDQPANVGFSYGSQKVKSSAGAAVDVYALLTMFFHQYPQYAKLPFHVAGESYAGHYIPAIAQEILKWPNPSINLKSIMIGNGLTEPATQYKSYRPMACGGGGYPAVLNDTACKAMDAMLPGCERDIEACYAGGSDSVCAGATKKCNSLLDAYSKAGRNIYDVRQSADAPGPTTYALKFLYSDRVAQALNIPEAAVNRFTPCNMSVYIDFIASGDWMRAMSYPVVQALSKISVLIYAGDADFIGNWLGNRAWLQALWWPGRDAFNKAPAKGVRAATGKDDYGKVTAAQNLAFMQIYKAGHTVTTYQPEGALDMLNRWVKGEWARM